jgi:hypothetical protein
MAKPVKSIKINPGQAVLLQNALDTLEPHIIKAAETWAWASPEQREFLVNNSPVLVRFLAMASPFEVR